MVKYRQKFRLGILEMEDHKVYGINIAEKSSFAARVRDNWTGNAAIIHELVK